MSLAWRVEPAAPTPLGVLGLGAASRHLHSRLEAMPEATRTRLTVTAHGELLLLAGDFHQLPWFDGAHYVAPRAEAPGLWLPTTRRPDVPLDLLATAIARRHPQQPMLLWPEPAQLVPLQRLVPARDEVLARIRRLWDR